MNKKEFLKDDKKWYNDFYGTETGYSLDPDNCEYTEIWNLVLSKILNIEAIADIGCGCGQFAQLAIRRGKNYRFGVDFSEKAIALAKTRNPRDADKFVVGDLREFVPLHQFDVAVILETMEHLEDDLALFRIIPEDTHILMTVPSFDYTSHYRFFSTLTEACSRYKDKMLIASATGVPFTGDFTKSKTNMIWILEGFRNEAD